jgi:SlyX protein
MTDERIDKIEMALMHQDEQIQDLSDMISAQWKEIDRLSRLLRKAEAKLSEMAYSGSEDEGAGSIADMAAEDKPPHY